MSGPSRDRKESSNAPEAVERFSSGTAPRRGPSFGAGWSNETHDRPVAGGVARPDLLRRAGPVGLGYRRGIRGAAARGFERFESAWAIGIVLIADLVAPCSWARVRRGGRPLVAPRVRGGGRPGPRGGVRGHRLRGQLRAHRGAGARWRVREPRSSRRPRWRPPEPRGQGAAARRHVPVRRDQRLRLRPAPRSRRSVLVGGGPDLVLLANGVTFAHLGGGPGRLRFGAAPVRGRGARGAGPVREAHGGDTRRAGHSRALDGAVRLGEWRSSSAASLNVGGASVRQGGRSMAATRRSRRSSRSPVWDRRGVARGGAGGSPASCAALLARAVPHGVGFFVSGLVPGDGAGLRDLRRGGVRQRPDAGLRAADHPGAGSRPTDGAHLRGEGRPHGVGVRARVPRRRWARRGRWARGDVVSPPARRALVVCGWLSGVRASGAGARPRAGPLADGASEAASRDVRGTACWRQRPDLVRGRDDWAAFAG